MAGHQKDPLRLLTIDEPIALEQLGRSRADPAAQVVRAKELLAVAAGSSFEAAAHAAGRRHRSGRPNRGYRESCNLSVVHPLTTAWLWSPRTRATPAPTPKVSLDSNAFRLRFTDLPTGYTSGMDAPSASSV